MLFAHFHVLPIVCMHYFCPEFVWAEGIQLSLLLFLLKKKCLEGVRDQQQVQAR